MASPNRTAITMMGMKLTTGPSLGTPKRPASQPHWNTATVAPKPAATDSRNPAAALTGMRKERNTIKLLDSARALFAERGFQATSAADIAAAAGVTERTLFRYFPSKSALVLDEVIAL